MASLDPRLAQQIVERTMQVIPFNVNVMDTRGIIIGSGKPARIGELHAGAQIALGQQRPVEIDEAAAHGLPGVQPGVNLPLKHRGQICGVVGLTGAPDTVRQFGELVRIAAEMILEQSQLMGELLREKRYREEFVFHLVTQENTTPADLEAWAVRLGVDLARPRAAVVLTLDDEQLGPDLALGELQRVQNRLAARDPELLSAAISPRELVILEAFETSGSRSPQPAYAGKRLAALETVVRQALDRPASLSMGVALPGIEGVALSYRSALRTARVGRLRNPQACCLSYYDLSLPVLLAGLASGWQAEHLRQPLARLDAADRRDGPLRQTLAAWFANDMQASATARALGIHRNTLDYRLRQIGEITGLVLSRTDDRLLLYIAMQLE